MLERSLLALVILAAPLGAAAQVLPSPSSPVYGLWLTENRRGVIELFPCADKVCGKLVWMIEPIRRGAPAVDDENPNPDLRQRPLCNMMMLGDFRQSDPQHWEDGWIYDPDSGKTYHANMALGGPNLLKLRGYVGIPLFGETQDWTRADGSLGSCTQASAQGITGRGAGPAAPQQRQ